MQNHRHLILTGRGLRKPPRITIQANAWLLALTELVGMKVFFGPLSKRCDVPGNEGVTGIISIETSHASMHCWDEGESPFIQCDLYSCADFDIEVVIKHLVKFDPTEIEYLLVDRNGRYQMTHDVRKFR